mmetsp:Transcript_8874/g.17585  ORF Transcript_8874/g.17585 Transcript_8874/m.17585 type:complete len:327 (-) Transcript_8874:142-1122(-)
MTFPSSSIYSLFFWRIKRSKNLVKTLSVVRNSTMPPFVFCAKILGTRSAATSSGWAARTPKGNLRSSMVIVFVVSDRGLVKSTNAKLNIKRRTLTLTRCGIIKQKLSENHARRQTVNLNSSLSLNFFIPLHSLVEFLYQTGCQLGKTAFSGSVCCISRSSTSLDPRSDSVKNVSRHSFLLRHNIHSNLCAVQNPQQIYFHDGLNLPHRQLHQSSSPAINPRIVDPISDITQLLLREFPQLLAALGVTDVAFGVENSSVGMSGHEGFGGGGAIADVADDDVVASVHEFSSVGESHSSSASCNYDSSIGHRHRKRRRGRGGVERAIGE